MNIQLLIIDPQYDFCDIPEALQATRQDGSKISPALAVPGGFEDMNRVAKFLDRAGHKIDDIHVTMDSHNPLDVAHPMWWVNSAGQNPAPFTLISADDVSNGVWRSANPGLQTYSLNYVKSLAIGGRYPLIIWPEHCLIGHVGHNIHAGLMDSLDNWARKGHQMVDFVTKGSNPFTEHYSAVKAEVSHPRDPGTQLNGDLINTLMTADVVLIAGEALSHCVANTVRDIANEFGDSNISKLVLLRDCTSSVGGFEQMGQDFLSEMTSRGMKVSTSTDYLA